ncbi:omega-6 fatty acid desaturase (delta-12 desaturase) [Pullulanibacillus pueri]|uniref:Fatty acid desaturase n=1 Tax=Pullulanibacillus pueri TaxID=1437324 RepID=A0A8J2ZSB4_9BACL|nr:fatty acid desaturase [Pullulanibacillus pueri]MBM7679920.1 omega-6 fatty acid desaturase (delta-12 desaturase) [Pullulanibacillus pueri]GGH73495.1 fatty acid desaturase [Pullulanibacillus pueri]
MSKQKITQLKKSVAPYAKSETKKSIIQMINTLIPFFGLWFLAYESLSISVWLTIPLAILAAGFVIRIFIIFHDCAHLAFFKNKRANRIVGTITGIITMFPYEQWKREHSIHHATSSNLDKRGVGDVWVMTVDEYVEASFWGRLQYRLYRHPIVLFGLGPLFLFLIKSRFNQKGVKKKERWNTYIINISILVIYALLIAMIGWQAFLIIQLPILMIAGSFGIWLFYVQHQFEDSYFESEEEWDFVKAAVEGSSFYKLPKVLQWISGNIGYHHVHHLIPRVPNYNLEVAHNSTPELQYVTTITLSTSLQSIHFRLYDEANKTFVTFKEIKPLLDQKKKSTQRVNKTPSVQEK